MPTWFEKPWDLGQNIANVSTLAALQEITLVSNTGSVVLFRLMKCRNVENWLTSADVNANISCFTLYIYLSIYLYVYIFSTLKSTTECVYIYTHTYIHVCTCMCL